MQDLGVRLKAVHHTEEIFGDCGQGVLVDSKILLVVSNTDSYHLSAEVGITCCLPSV